MSSEIYITHNVPISIELNPASKKYSKLSNDWY